MGLSDAKRLLQWNCVTAALADAGVDAEIMSLVEHAWHIDDTCHSMARVLIGGADAKQTKNYVKVEMTGMGAPFERAYVELVRPGGKTSHELRELLRDRLTHVRRLLADRRTFEKESCHDGLIAAIDEDLATEAP